MRRRPLRPYGRRRPSLDGGRSRRSITAWDSLVRRPKRLARPPIDRALDDATVGSAGNDCAGASRRCSGFGVDANTSFCAWALRAGLRGLPDTVRAPKLASATKSMCTSICNMLMKGRLNLSWPVTASKCPPIRSMYQFLKVDRGRLDHVPSVANVKPQTVREHDAVASQVTLGGVRIRFRAVRRPSQEARGRGFDCWVQWSPWLWFRQER
jgi:hypothetical protein